MVFQETPIFVFRGPFGIPVEIGGSILFLAMLFIGFGATNPDLLLQGVILFAMVVVSLFLHELGHAWGARVQGVPVQCCYLLLLSLILTTLPTIAKCQ